MADVNTRRRTNSQIIADFLPQRLHEIRARREVPVHRPRPQPRDLRDALVAERLVRRLDQQIRGDRDDVLACSDGLLFTPRQ